MKKFWAVAALLIIAIGFVTAEERRVVVPVNVSFFPMYGFSSSVTVVNNLQINVGVGYADELNGVAMGVVSIIGEEVHGVQAGVVNLTGGRVAGAQVGVVNMARRDVFGAQVGVVNGSLDSVRGPQVGVVNLSKDSTSQTGVVNAAMNASGVQIGVVNVAARNDGAPIGLVSVVLDGGRTHAQSWIDETGLVNVGLIHGSQTTYNIYTAATDPTLERVSLGLGLGAHLGGRKSWARVEALGSSVNRVDDLFGSSVSLFRARLYTGYQFGPVALIAGASFNYLMDFSDDGAELSPLHGYEFGFSTENHRFWPGAFVGVQL